MPTDEEHAGVLALYVAHFVGAWGDRMWQFATPILFVDIFGDTLLPSALYAICVYSCCVLCVPAVGAWVDRSERLWVVQLAIAVDNACVLATSALLALLALCMLGEGGGGAPADAYDDVAATPASLPPRALGLYALVVLLGCVGEAMNQAQNLAIERDWVVQICGADSARLGGLNTVMQRIDLVAKVLAPALVGVALQLSPDARLERVLVGAALLGGWAALALPLELCLALRVYSRHEAALACKEHEHHGGLVHAHRWGARVHAHPELPGGGLGGAESGGEAARDARHTHGDGTEHAHCAGHVEHVHVVDTSRNLPIVLVRDGAAGAGARCCADGARSAGAACARACHPAAACAAAARRLELYARHPVAGASVAISLLYSTVLDNGALMTAYLQWRRVPPALLGGSRAAGAAFGLAGTFAFPRVTARFGGRFERTGLVAIWSFWLCIAPVGAAFALGGGLSAAADYVLLGCVVASRAALWTFDLAETQVMQERVQPRLRGTLNGVQTSLCQGCYVLVMLAGAACHRPAQFGLLVGWSVAAVLLAALTYTRWYLMQGRTGGALGEAAPPLLDADAAAEADAATRDTAEPRALPPAAPRPGDESDDDEHHLTSTQPE